MTLYNYHIEKIDEGKGIVHLRDHLWGKLCTCRYNPNADNVTQHEEQQLPLPADGELTPCAKSRAVIKQVNELYELMPT